MLDQHHPTLLCPTCWVRLNTMLDICCIMLDDVGSSLILFKLFIQHRPTFDEKLVQRHRFHGDLH